MLLRERFVAELYGIGGHNVRPAHANGPADAADSKKAPGIRGLLYGCAVGRPAELQASVVRTLPPPALAGCR